MMQYRAKMVRFKKEKTQFGRRDLERRNGIIRRLTNCETKWNETK